MVASLGHLPVSLRSKQGEDTPLGPTPPAAGSVEGGVVSEGGGRGFKGAWPN